MASIIKRAIGRIRKTAFVKRFHHFGMSSGIGDNSTGKGCRLSGTERISIGEDCFFGAGTELVALDHHFDQQLNSQMEIGNHVRCVGGCRITCAGSITLGNDVLIGPEVFITDHNHGMNPAVEGGVLPPATDYKIGQNRRRSLAGTACLCSARGNCWGS